MPNYLQFSKTGLVESFSDTSEYQSDWIFLEFPTTGIDNRSGTAPTVEPGTGFYLFSNSQAESVLGSLHLPHSIDLDGDFFPAVKWTKTTSAAGGVVWGLESRKVSPGNALPAFGPIVYSTVGSPDLNTADLYAIDIFPKEDIDEGLLDPTEALGEIVNFRLSRQVGEPGDTYSSNARLLAFGLYVEVNTLGSEQILEK